MGEIEGTYLEIYLYQYLELLCRHTNKPLRKSGWGILALVWFFRSSDSPFREDVKLLWELQKYRTVASFLREGMREWKEPVRYGHRHIDSIQGLGQRCTRPLNRFFCCSGMEEVVACIGIENLCSWPLSLWKIWPNCGETCGVHVVDNVSVVESGGSPTITHVVHFTLNKHG